MAIDPKIGLTCISIESLGICERCGEILCMENLPSEAIDAEWHCPGCEGILSHRSFGFASEQGGRAKWVGPDKKWTTTKPPDDFELGSWYVSVRPLPVYYI